MGAAVALAFGLPFLGRLGSVPMSTLAFLAPGISLAAFAFLPRDAKAWNASAAAVLGLLAAYIALVVVSASSSQFAFFLTPTNWLARSDHYYDAKLVTFAIAAVPGLLAALPLLLARPSEHVLRGFLGAALVIALLAVVRVLPYANLLAGTEHAQARIIIANPYGVGFSVVSIGILCCVGAASALVLRGSWPLVALFLFIAFWINRRTETALIILMLAAYAGRGLLAERTWKSPARSGAVLAVSLFAATVLHNEANIATWMRVSESVAERSEILSLAVVSTAVAQSVVAEASEASDSLDAGAAPPAAKFDKRAASPAAQNAGSFLRGHGLGWYATLGSEHPYPHNLYLETLKESGATAAALLIAAVCLSLAAVASGAGALSGPRFGVTMTAVAIVAVSAKAGDISTAGRMFPLLILSAFVHPNAVSPPHLAAAVNSKVTRTWLWPVRS